MKKNLPLIVFGCLLILFLPEMIRAQVQGNPELKAPAPLQPGINKSSSKLSSDLTSLYDSYVPNARRGQSSSAPLEGDKAVNKYVQVRGDKVLVDITVKGDNNSARAELEKLGFKVTAVFGRVISGMMPIKALPQLESAANVKFAAPAYKPLHQSQPAGSSSKWNLQNDSVTQVISQGDTAQRSYIARQKYKVNGKGVKVGILSDSYNNLGTADVGVMRGELPGPGNPYNFKKPVQVLLDLDSGGTDEGRGMAEIVHDVAPGSEIAFHTADFGQANFAQGILSLAEAGCKVIVDDVYYFAEPFFQDGIIAQAVDIAKANGTTYFSAAGNQSVRSYESDYRATQFEPFGDSSGTAHNFNGPGDAPRYYQPVYIPTNGDFLVSFQWDQPFYSAGGTGSESDLDIYLLDAQGRVVAIGGSDNIKSGDPVEVFEYINRTRSNTFYLAIVKFSGPDPSRLKYIMYGDGAFYLTTPAIPGILAPTIVGHAKAEGAIATGAVYYKNTPAYGVDTPLIESYSSKGGVANYFDIQGNRIAPLVRPKPEISAPDGGNTSFFYADDSDDTDTFPNFYGTSAAAPHAAAVAALMIQGQKLNTITPSQIKGVLAANTVDMDDIYTTGFDKGFDYNTGMGFIKADDAVGAVRFPKVYLKNLNLKPTCSDDPATTRNWKIINPNPFDVKAHWFIIGTQLQGDIVVPPGESNYSTPTAYNLNKPFDNVAIIDWEDNFGFPRFDVASASTAACSNAAFKSDNDNAADKVVDARTITKPNTAEVYPNPSSTNFRLYLSVNSDEKVNIELYSIDGKSLYRKMVPSKGVVDIDASGYKAGVYLLKVKQGDFNKTMKLIKQ